jgi:hypothetical protein
MNKTPDSFSDVQRIYFIAEDATGPFRMVVRLRLKNGQSVSFEGKSACEKLVRWLYDYDLAIAKQIESLLNEREKRNLELLLFRRE